MSQPELEPMNTTEAEQAIEAFLEENPLTDEEMVETEEDNQDADVEDTEEESEETEESEEQESEDSDDETQDSIETLAELAEALELPLEEVMANLKTTVKVNGEEIPVTLKEAFDGYQKDADYRQKTSDLAQQRRTFDDELAQTRQQIEHQFIQLGQFIQQAEQQFIPALDKAQMEYLKQTDPQQYLIKRQEYEERVAQVGQLKQAAANQFSAIQQQQAEQLQQQQAEIVKKAGEELLTRIPDWGEETKTQVDSYLTGELYGYSLEELGQVVDPRLIQIAHKAMLYDEQSQKADVVTKKVKTLPKVQPKGSQAKVKPKTERLQKARARLKKSGSIDDAAAAVEQLLFN